MLTRHTRHTTATWFGRGPEPRTRRLLVLASLAGLSALRIAPAVAAQSYVTDVPCWNQVTLVGAPGGSTGDWRAWCIPTAAASVVGFHRDNGVSGLADSQTFPGTGSWGASDFQDDCADSAQGVMHMGYFLDTNGLGIGGAASHDGTRLADVRAGLEGYFDARSFGAVFIRNYGAPSTTTMPSSLYCDFDTTRQPQGSHSDAGAWEEIKREIAAGRPLLGHFTHGNYTYMQLPDDGEDFEDASEWRLGDWDPNGDTSGDEGTGEQWSPAQGLGHTMTIVGFWESPSPLGGDALIVFDNRDTPPGGNPVQTQRLPLLLPWAGAPWAGLTSVSPARLIHVDADATGNDDGTSWSDAYTDLQSALADAGGGSLPAEIWVAEGTYRPAGAGGSRFTSFQMIDAVSIYGGFDGTETSRDQRDPAVNVTVLSGDLDGDDASVGRTDNSYHVVSGTGADASAILDGFTITAGHGDNPVGAENRGAGMINTAQVVFAHTDAPTVVGCTFIDNNTISHAGAMYNRDVAATVISCRFLGNSGGNVGGGAVLNWRSASTYVNCLFSGNQCTSGNGGGGMLAQDTPDPTLIGCTFSMNASINATTGGGGGLIVTGSVPDLTNCIFWGNTDSNVSGEAAQVYLHAPGFDSVNMNHCCVEGLTGALGGSNNIGGSAGHNPLFVDADGADNTAGTEDDDLRLQSGSACIDAGDGTVLPCQSTDLDGGDRDVGNGPDMGAYENDQVPEPILSDDLETGELTGWSTSSSTNGEPSGTECPGTWISDLDTPPIEGAFSMRLFAQATSSCFPWLLGAVREQNVGLAQQLTVTLRFDQIQGAGGNGHSFFQVIAQNAADPSRVYTYTFSEGGAFGGDAVYAVDQNDLVILSTNLAADYASKYGEALTDEVILKFRASADYAEGSGQVRTTEVAVDGIDVSGFPDPCPADSDGNGWVDVLDLLGLLGAWGGSDPAYDIVPDGMVNVSDLLALLGAWGEC